MYKYKQFVGALALSILAACGGSTISGPSPEQSEPQASAPVVQATPAPQPVADPTPSGSSFKLYGEKGVLYVEYSGSVRTAVETYYTSFDDQTTKFAVQVDNVEPKSTLKRSFPVSTCFQGDAEQVGVKPIGGVFFDINGDPFNPTKNPEKVAECRNQCVPKWELLEEVRIIGEWVEYTPEQNADTVDSKCYKYYRRLVIKREKNSCTREERDKGEQYYEYKQTEVQCPCVLNPSYSQNVTRANYTNAVPEVEISGYLFPNNSIQVQSACTSNGGVFHNGVKFCQISKLFGSDNEWDEGEGNPALDFPGGSIKGQWDSDFDLVEGTDKNGIVLVGTVTGDDATWRFKLSCGNTTKDDESFTRTCAEGPKTLPAETTGGIQIGDGQFGYISSNDHEDSTCYLEVFKNGSLQQTITYLPVN